MIVTGEGFEGFTEAPRDTIWVSVLWASFGGPPSEARAGSGRP
jgi:hypothetical protein